MALELAAWTGVILRLEKHKWLHQGTYTCNVRKLMFISQGASVRFEFYHQNYLPMWQQILASRHNPSRFPLIDNDCINPWLSLNLEQRHHIPVFQEPHFQQPYSHLPHQTQPSHY